MSELYGAPSGIVASEEMNRRNVLGALEVQKTLGEIEKQPAEKALAEAHARLFGSEADLKGEQVAAAREAREWEAKFAAADRLRLINQVPLQAGRNANVGDLPAESASRIPSQADRLVAQADWMDAQGAPPHLTAPLRKEITAILEKESSARHTDAQAVSDRTNAQMKQMDIVGGIVGTAARSPQDYLALMGNPAMLQQLPPQIRQALTGDFQTDAPVLRAIADASIEAKDKANLALKAKDDANKASLRASEIGVNKQRARLLSYRADDLKVAADYAAKHGGPAAQPATEAQRAAMEAAKERVFAKQLTFAPMAPLDITAYKAGNLYTTKDRRLVRYLGDGKFQEIAGAEKSGLLRRAIEAEPIDTLGSSNANAEQ